MEKPTKFYVAKEHPGVYHLVVVENVKLEHVMSSFEEVHLLEMPPQDPCRVKFPEEGLCRLILRGNDGRTATLTINSHQHSVFEFPLFTALGQVCMWESWLTMDILHKV